MHTPVEKSLSLLGKDGQKSIPPGSSCVSCKGAANVQDSEETTHIFSCKLQMVEIRQMLSEDQKVRLDTRAEHLKGKEREMERKADAELHREQMRLGKSDRTGTHSSGMPEHCSVLKSCIQVSANSGEARPCDPQAVLSMPPKSDLFKGDFLLN